MLKNHGKCILIRLIAPLCSDGVSYMTREWQYSAEFELLVDLHRSLYISVKRGVTLKGETLIKAREHIETCSYIIADDLDKYVLIGAYTSWLICRVNWQYNMPPGDENLSIPDLRIESLLPSSRSSALQKRPEPKPFNELLGPESSNDRRFLRSLRIKIDDDEKGDDKKTPD